MLDPYVIPLQLLGFNMWIKNEIKRKNFLKDIFERRDIYKKVWEGKKKNKKIIIIKITYSYQFICLDW